MNNAHDQLPTGVDRHDCIFGFNSPDDSYAVSEGNPDFLEDSLDMFNPDLDVLLCESKEKAEEIYWEVAQDIDEAFEGWGAGVAVARFGKLLLATDSDCSVTGEPLHDYQSEGIYGNAVHSRLEELPKELQNAIAKLDSNSPAR